MGTDEGRFKTGDPMRNTLRFRTAPRLLTGISAVIGQSAILALDWNMDWNNKIHLTGTSADRIEQSKQRAGELYKPAHTFRAGLEVRATHALSLRAGGSYMPDFMRDKGFVGDNPTIKSSCSITGGVGFNLGNNGYLDAAYVYNHARMTDYDFYYFERDGLWAAQWDNSGGIDIPRSYSPTRNRHMITLTLGSRF
jgi:long-subunit fatty acid transport protein